MNRLRTLLTFSFVFLTSPVPLSAQTGAVPGVVDRQIELYEAELAVAYAEGVEKAFQAKVRDLDLKYFQAVDRALEAATRAAQLEEALAIREEKKRFEEQSGVPAGDAPGDPTALVQLRATYRTQIQKLEAERDLAAAPLFTAHDAKLEAYQTLLTTEGKLDDALKVKAARAEVAKRLAKAAAGSPSGRTAEEGWQVIFDGGSLDLWKPQGSSRNFQIEEGILVVKRSTEEADFLFLKGNESVPETLRNFELKATVKADAEANSGFYFHINGRAVGRGGHPASGVEVSLHSGAKPTKFPTGSIYDVTPMEPSSLNQSDWFEIHFKVVDRVVTVLLNGQPYLEHLVPAAAGPDMKGIQVEGGRLAIQANSKDGAYHFQKISIKPLP
jgi:hypothetical protein